MKKYIGNIVCLSNNINRYLVSHFGWSDFGVIYWSGDFTEDSIRNGCHILIYSVGQGLGPTYYQDHFKQVPKVVLIKEF